MDVALVAILFIVLVILLRSIVQINEYERGIKFNRGKFSKILEPGWRIHSCSMETM